MITISIITVCLNSGKTIKRTFDCVLAQTVLPLEYIVIDGKSTDNTVDIIKEYGPSFKNKGVKFNWISEKDKGIYDAMDKGIRMANGDYIGIINSDDYYMPWTVQTISEEAAQHQDVDVFHGLLRHTSNGVLSRVTGLPSSQLKNNMIEHPTCFVKRTVYQKFGLFNLRYKYVADYELMIRLKRKGCNFYLIEKVLADFEENGAGNSWVSQKETLRLKRKEDLLSQKGYLLSLVKAYIHNILIK